jgi:hypothetical protein
MICDNPQCQYHRPCPRGMEREPAIAVSVPHGLAELGPLGPADEEATYTRHVVERHPFLRRGIVLYYLCTACKDAGVRP